MAVTETPARAFCPLTSTSRQVAPSSEDAAAAPSREEGAEGAARGLGAPLWQAADVNAKRTAAAIRVVCFKTKVLLDRMDREGAKARWSGAPDPGATNVYAG